MNILLGNRSLCQAFRPGSIEIYSRFLRERWATRGYSYGVVSTGWIYEWAVCQAWHQIHIQHNLE
jgi:hypothetical protein